nr:hypothetical protein [Chloroflexia bacterium]
VVLGVPLVVAVVVTLWTLEQARQRNRKNRPGEKSGGPVKRNATRTETEIAVESDDRAAQDAPVQAAVRQPVRESGSPG